MTTNTNASSSPRLTMGAAIVIGIAIGTAVGVAMEQIAVGVGLGTAIGVLLALAAGRGQHDTP